MTVTPVLADQLEDAGRRERLRRLPGRVADRRRRSRRCPRCRPSAGPPARRSWRATGGRWSCSTRPAATRWRPFQRGRRGGAGGAGGLLGDPRGAAAAGDPGGPAAAARRRDPLAPAPLRLGRGLLAARVRLRARPRVAAGRARRGLVLRRPERPRGAAGGAGAGRAPRPGRWRCRSTGRRSAGSGRSTATRPTPPTPSSPANRCAGSGSGRSAAAPTTRPPPPPRPAARPASSSPRRRPACATSPPSAAAAACSSSRSTPSCSATGGRRGRSGCGRCSTAPRRRGCGWSPCPQALAEHEPVERPLARLDLGRGEGLRTWDSPAVADLAWGARRLELRLLRALSEGLRGDAALRAARELLAAQASDWAFLDGRGQAGDYAYQRATDHAGAMLEAIDSASVTDPRMRSLAPDLSLAPLLEP